MLLMCRTMVNRGNLVMSLYTLLVNLMKIRILLAVRKADLFKKKKKILKDGLRFF